MYNLDKINKYKAYTGLERDILEGNLNTTLY